MKKKSILIVSLSLMILSVLTACKMSAEKTKVIAYPAIEGLTTCADLKIEVDGNPVWVENLKRPIPPNAPDWFRNAPVTQNMEVNIASFSCADSCRLKIKLNKPASSVIVRPKSRKIPVSKNKNEVNLSLSGPCKLYIEIDSMPPLMIFANPLETDVPKAGSNKIKIFGPGVHNPGLITLKDSDIVYIAPGAIVYGGFRSSAHGAKVFGHGIVDGSKMRQSMVSLNGASNIEFNGIILRCGNGWQNTLTNCDSITYRNVKIMSFVPYGDGLDPVCSRNITIDDCFFRCSDDCISVKASQMGDRKVKKVGPDVANILVTNCVMAGYTFSDGFTIGFETNANSIKDVLVKNCDILYAQSSNKIGGHSAFSIICDGPADIRNITWEDIRVEENVLKLFELNISDGQIYTKAPPGHIKGVYLKNISWEIEAPIILWGFSDSNMVEDVTFEGCTVAGKPFAGLEYSQLKINQFVKNVKVIN